MPRLDALAIAERIRRSTQRKAAARNERAITDRKRAESAYIPNRKHSRARLARAERRAAVTLNALLKTLL